MFKKMFHIATRTQRSQGRDCRGYRKKAKSAGFRVLSDRWSIAIYWAVIVCKTCFVTRACILNWAKGSSALTNYIIVFNSRNFIIFVDKNESFYCPGCLILINEQETHISSCSIHLSTVPYFPVTNI